MLRDTKYKILGIKKIGVLCFLDEKTTHSSEVSRCSTTKSNLFVKDEHADRHTD